jgi:hypothetical protein
MTEINTLKYQLDCAGKPSILRAYDKYALKTRGVIQEGISTEESDVLNGYDLSNVHVMTFGIHDSMFLAVSDLVQNYIGKANAVVVDLTNSLFLSAALKTSNIKEYGFELLEQTCNFSEFEAVVGKTSLLLFNVCHDIALLTLNWSVVLSNLITYAGSRKIMILLPPFSSFNTMMAFSKLMSIGAHCWVTVPGSSPIAARELGMALKFLSNRNFTILATHCTQQSSGLLQRYKSIATMSTSQRGIEYDRCDML